MKDYIELWRHNVTTRWAQTVESGIEITGERDKHLGALHGYAKITIYVEPSDHFEVVDLVESTNRAREEGFPDNFIFGLLDILVRHRQSNLRDRFPITVTASVARMSEATSGIFVCSWPSYR